ncbi:MAG: PTS system mannose/fructose/sorbose family transporter subunit IID [Elusimicrobiaceae bacterium]|nr:PTS system mannose/fructose/sorbose family transporter subunit IID [Elusimicrobiaceae bacterium]
MDKLIQARTFMRMLLLQGGWNFEGMQNLGFAFAMRPALARIYSGERLVAAMRRHMEAFNTQPFMAGFALGLVIRMEELAAALPPDLQEAEFKRISVLKRTLGSVTAAIGDRFFWGTARAIGFVILLLVWWAGGFSRWADSPWALDENYYTVHWKVLVAGLAAGVVIYNAFSLWIRWRGISYGYKCASDSTCGLDYLNWQLLIRYSRQAGFVMAILAGLLYFHTLLSVSVYSAGFTAGALRPVLLAVGAGLAAVWARRKGYSSVYLYLLAVGLAGLAYSIA